MNYQNNIIYLRVLSYQKDNEFFSVCLDTGILTCAKSMQESLVKMNDALTVYMKSFTQEEINAGDYIRKAPLKYFLKMFFLPVIFLFKKYKGQITSAEFDFSKQNLKFA